MSARDNPQNPYVSFVVAASAGSGKTYQLSRRFLYLVGAGAAPGAILTVTFTKKAAGEMRCRILEAAATLAASPAEQARFDAELATFRRADGAGGPPAVPAWAVARLVLASSQLLKISTIDSLYLEWVSKFPCEAGGGAGEAGLPAPLSLLDPAAARELDRRAWRATCQLLSRGLRRGDPAVTALLEACPDGSVRDLEGRLAGLDRLETYLWYVEQGQGSGAVSRELGAFLPHPSAALALAGLDAPPAWHGLELATLSEPALMALLACDMRAIAAQLADAERRARCHAALDSGVLAALVATELLTKLDHGVSGRYLRGKKRDAVAGPIGRVEALLRAYHDHQRLAGLNRTGAAQYRLYQVYRSLRDRLKLGLGAVEFRDLVKGCYRLFHGDAGAGVRFLLARTVQHLLLDEFQDTSRLQWAVFGEMAAQLLAGRGVEAPGGPLPTVFIVGDAKQSIYGFREADPAVMADAAAALADRLHLAPLNASFRTAQVVLDFVNVVFGSGGDDGFPPHATAAAPDSGEPNVPDVGRVMLAPLLDESAVPAASGGARAAADDEADEPPAALALAEREAALVAGWLSRALSGELPCPVYDKQTRTFRPLTPADCCLLYRSTTKAAVFEAALRRAGIPCQREEAKGYFARPEIADALALLRFLALPGDMLALATVLRSPLAGLADAALIAVLAASKGAPERAQVGLARLAEADPPLASALAQLLGRSAGVPPHQLLLEAYGRLDAFAVYGHGDRSGSAAATAEAALAQRNLLRLAELCMRLEDEGVAQLLPLVERLETMAADDELGNAGSARRGVTLMTIHKSKGLEFPLVAVVDAGRPWGRRDVHWTQGTSAAGDAGVYYIGRRDEQPRLDPAFLRLADGAEAATQQECQRLLYVALTRARQYLLVTGHAAGRGGQGLSSTSVYAQLAAAAARPPAGRHLDQALTVAPELLEAGLSAWSAGAAELDRRPAPHPAAVDDAGGAALPWALTCDLRLPRELVVKSPSAARAASTARQLDDQTRLRPAAEPLPGFAAALGTFVHKGLEAFMQGQAFAAAPAWQVAAAGLASDAAKTPALELTALAELAAVLADPELAQLKRRAQRLETELAVVHRRGAELIVGALDLLVEDRRGHLTIVDYKTTHFAGGAELLADVTDDELRRYAAGRGYDAQLGDYALAVAALYPAASVATAVYFTSLRRLVTISGVSGQPAAKRRGKSPAGWRQVALFGD